MVERKADNGPGVVISQGANVETDDDTSVTQIANLLAGDEDATDDDDDKNSAAASADDDAPDDSPASGDDDSDEPESDDAPAIEAPASWGEKGKAIFAKLDTATQQFLLAREGERDKGVNVKLEEVAASRKAVEAEQAAVKQIRSAYERNLLAFAVQLENSIPEEFKAIKSPADLYAVSQKDPALAQRFQAYQQQAASVVNQLQQLEAQRQNEATEAHKKLLSEEYSKLQKAWPEFSDAVKGPTIRAELTAHAKERGFTPEEIAGAADHRLMLLLKDAVEGRKAIKALEKAKAKLKGKNLPEVARPGKGQAAGQRGNGLDRANLNSALRSGNQDRQVAAMAKILENIQ